MKLVRWVQIGELLSSVAVLITLIIFIFEIRDNTSAIRADSYGQGIDRINQWRAEVTGNAELAGILNSYTERDTSKLNSIELTQLRLHIGSLWSIFESAYYASRYSTLGASEWERFENQICNQYVAGIDLNMWEGFPLSSEFKEYVQSYCEVRSSDGDT